MPVTMLLAILLLAFAISFAGMPFAITLLHRSGFGKRIRVDGPASHAHKAGTPAGGGVLVLIVAIALSLIAANRPEVIFMTATLAVFGLLGLVDDHRTARSTTGYGLPVRLKLPLHAVIALAGAGILYGNLNTRLIDLPGYGRVDIGGWFVPLALVVILATASSTNEIDGLDGLAAGTLTIAYTAYLTIAWQEGKEAIAIFCATVVGSLLAFLWFNIQPAQVFLGDAGAVALGAALGVVALLTEQPLLLLVIGFVFFITSLSVIAQVTYFKATGGKRLLLMSPLHHHLELSGWSEGRIVQRYWLVAVVTGIFGLLLAWG
ncbi:MAG: phospho-N-acetylmuramoyl-pentapeptide-transferase [Chloroflexi bacterium]|nr:phospho-N-acetylmuramoyl-pentapeptide-transferase [Chloroflexota bacterium]